MRVMMPPVVTIGMVLCTASMVSGCGRATKHDRNDLETKRLERKRQQEACASPAGYR